MKCYGRYKSWCFLEYLDFDKVGLVILEISVGVGDDSWFGREIYVFRGYVFEVEYDLFGYVWCCLFRG